MKRSKRTPQSITILQPQEFKALLINATLEVLPVIVLGGFCGLRSSEILSLDWSAIHFDRKMMAVEGGIKTFHRRVVPLPDAAAAWLMPIAKDSGRVVPYRSQTMFLFATKQVWKAAGVKWRTNNLRCSAGSYMFAMCGNAKQTATELGNSAPIVEHLGQFVSREDAEKWFGIFPKTT